MLRGLRIVGIIVFAVLVGLSAHRIQKLYNAGTLFETYNSARKSNITLLSFSVLGLGVLSYLEISKSRGRSRRRGYAPVQQDKPAKGMDDPNATSIYSRPETLGKWADHRTRSSRPHHREKLQADDFCLNLLRILFLSLSVVYALLLVSWGAGWVPVVGQALLMYGAAGLILILSLVSMWGITKKKGWGLKLGYAVGMSHLLIFPVGTAVGLILLVALVGATPSFSVGLREQRRMARNKRRQEIRTT